MNDREIPEKIISAAKRIRLLLLDCDGVMTDGRLYFGENGEALKAFDVQDGLGIVRWREAGFHVGIISGRSSSIVESRARDLKIEFVRQGSKDKLAHAREICDVLKIGLEQAAFVGDDLPDLEVMGSVGLGVAVANAVGEVRSAADHVTSCSGGRGAVRELIELLLRLKL